MKYVIALIVITGLSVGVYFMLQERPEARADGYSLNTLQVKPSDNQAPKYNPQQTENGAKLWK